MPHAKRVALFAAAAFGFAATSPADEWRQFRGPSGASVAASLSLPTEWSVETGANIAWEADLPGTGVSSPIVVDGRVIVTAASGPNRDRLHVLAFDAATGAELWQRQFWAVGRTQCYRTSSVAAPTPVTDGEQIYAFYSSNDLVCLDLDGRMKWFRTLTTDNPGLGNDLGMASSPVVVGDAVIVQCECQSSSFAAAFDRTSGADLWQTPRPARSNWSSPLGLPADEATGARAAVILQGGSGVALHDAATGEELWQGGNDGETIPSPAATGERIVAATDGLTLLKRTASGLEVVWNQGAVRPSASSPVVFGGRAFVIGRGGVLNAVDLETGKSAFKRRLGGSFWATPIVADGKLYCVNQNGKAFVVDAVGKGQVLGESDFGDSIYGSPAAADGGLYVRSNGKLWKIATIGQARAATPAPR